MTHKNMKGETMSASNGGRIGGRIPLLAGSAAAAILGGVAFAPSSAMAQATCVATPAPTGNGTAAVTIAAGTYNPGIACAYGPTTATVSTLGAITVGSTAGGTGIDLTATGANPITWVSTAGGVTGGAQNVGPVIDAASVSGPIILTVGAITGTTLQNTYGVQAVSTGGGAISVTSTGTINLNSSTAGAQQQSAIRAISTGGNGDVTITTSGAVTGRLRGIQAQSSGAGALTITATNTVAVNVSVGVGVAAIDGRTGAGLLTVNVSEGTNGSNIDGRSGAAILTNAGGDQVINVGRNRTVRADLASPATLNLTAVGATTITNLGLISSGSTGGGVVIRASGAAFTFTNQAPPPGSLSPSTIRGRIDLSGITGASTFSHEARTIWVTSAANDFGPGESSLTNAGTIILSGPTLLSGLETFDNSGSIEFSPDAITAAGDLSVRRSLSAPGSSFTASGVSELRMQANLGTGSQAACSGVLVADCLSLVGGQTSGVTRIRLIALGAITAEPNTVGITLVDVAGGESHAGDFVLDVLSTNYAEDPVYGAVLTTPGWLGFALQYDDATQRHVLATVVPSQKLEYVAALQEVMSIWHGTSDVVAGRQADLHDRGDPGVWVRVSGERTTRDVAVAYTAGGVDYDYDDEYEIETISAVGGMDLFAGEVGGGDFVAGVHGGAVKSKLERASSPTEDQIDGVTAGVYAGWWAETGLSLDATINANFLALEHDRPSEEVSDTSIISVGARGEAGWRMALGDSFYVQPLATVAYVRAEMKDVVQEGFTAAYEDVHSLRGALGVRAGGDLDMGATTLGYWVTGRAWKEFSGDGSLILATTAEDVAFADDLAGEFQEVGAGLSLSNSADTLEGYVSGGAKFADGSDNYSASFGLRLRW